MPISPKYKIDVPRSNNLNPIHSLRMPQGNVDPENKSNSSIIFFEESNQYFIPPSPHNLILFHPLEGNFCEPIHNTR